MSSPLSLTVKRTLATDGWKKYLTVTTNFGLGIRLINDDTRLTIETLTSCCGSAVVARAALFPNDLGCDVCGSSTIPGYFHDINLYSNDLNEPELEKALHSLVEGHTDPLLATLGVQAFMELTMRLANECTAWESHDVAPLLDGS